MPAPWAEEWISAFETVAVVGGRPIALEAHWQRLQASRRTMGCMATPSAVRRRMVEAARRLPKGADGFRMDVSSHPANPRVAVHVIPRWARRGAPTGGVDVITTVARVSSPAAGPAQVKSRERLAGALAWHEPRAVAPFELIVGNAQGLVAEGSVSNLLIVRRGQVITPPVWVGVLPGVVREAIIELARRARISVVEQPITRHEFYTAEEAFVTNSLLGVVPVRMADGRRIGRRCPGPITRRLRAAYARWARRAA